MVNIDRTIQEMADKSAHAARPVVVDDISLAQVLLTANCVRQLREFSHCVVYTCSSEIEIMNGSSCFMYVIYMFQLAYDQNIRLYRPLCSVACWCMSNG